MSNAMILAGIAGAVAVGAMSPGPSFVMVARTAVAVTRADGVAAAFGMGLGATLFSIAALFGLHALFAAVPWLYLAIKIIGGMYLVYLGFCIWKGARSPLVVDTHAGSGTPRSLRKSFLLGLGTQVSNPKTAVVYAGIFAALLPREVPAAFSLVLPVLVFCIETGWYLVVAVMLSSASPRSAYLRHKAWIDRTAGTVMALLGLKLVGSAGKL